MGLTHMLVYIARTYVGGWIYTTCLTAWSTHLLPTLLFNYILMSPNHEHLILYSTSYLCLVQFFMFKLPISIVVTVLLCMTGRERFKQLRALTFPCHQFPIRASKYPHQVQSGPDIGWSKHRQSVNEEYQVCDNC